MISMMAYLPFPDSPRSTWTCEVLAKRDDAGRTSLPGIFKAKQVEYIGRLFDGFLWDSDQLPVRVQQLFPGETTADARLRDIIISLTSHLQDMGCRYEVYSILFSSNAAARRKINSLLGLYRNALDVRLKADEEEGKIPDAFLSYWRESIGEAAAEDAPPALSKELAPRAAAGGNSLEDPLLSPSSKEASHPNTQEEKDKKKDAKKTV